MIATLDPRTPTFRDPAGSVLRAGDRIFRVVGAGLAGELEAFLETRAACDAARDALYSHFTRQRFETAAQPRWELVRFKQITGLHRWLYLYRLR